MLGAKAVATPLATSMFLSLLDGSSSVDATEYRQLVGSLQYLFLIWLDVAFIVNKLSQFMHRPTLDHMAILKSLLRYLKGILFLGVHFNCNSSLNLQVYVDLNWAENPNDRTLIFGYLVYLSVNPISWSSKK